MTDNELRLRTNELFDSIPELLSELFGCAEYPWEIIPKIGEYLKKIGKPAGYDEILPGVYVGKDVRIAKTAEIHAPAIICDGAEIRTGAYIRGNAYIGRGCVVGNSTELKNSIMLDGANAPHYNYVGDTIMGAHSHMGAGAVASNLKADKSNVTVHADRDYTTGLRKLGAILGDGADVGCGCVLNPGTVIGKKTSVYPLTSVRGAVAENSIMKSPSVVVKRV